MNKLTFADFVGNKGAVEKIELLIDDALKDRFARMPDMAFLGPSGHGKNTLAQVIANETKRKLLVINSTIIKDPFQFRGLIIGLTQDHDGSIVLVDECHALSRKIQNNLLTATEEPRELHTSHKDQTFTDKLPANFSFIFATTHGGNIRRALLSRLEQIEFLPYSLDEQLEMTIKYLIRRHKFKKEQIDAKCATEIAKRARSGREVVRFCDTIERYMRKHSQKSLNLDTINRCFDILGVDKNGLTRLDHIMLQKLQQMNSFVGLDTLDAILPSSKKEIKERIEPYLLKKGFIIRTSAGRMITPKGRAAINGDSQ